MAETSTPSEQENPQRRLVYSATVLKTGKTVDEKGTPQHPLAGKLLRRMYAGWEGSGFSRALTGQVYDSEEINVRFLTSQEESALIARLKGKN